MMQGLLEQARFFENNWNPPGKGAVRDCSVSVIIPVFYPEHLDAVIEHLESIGGFQELILVDDSGAFQSRDYDFVRSWDHVKVIYHEKNLGRPGARNTGAACSQGEILVFMDQDMFLNPAFFSALRGLYAANESLLLSGCRETVPFDVIPSCENWREPDLSKEWRIETEVKPEFLDLTVLGTGSAWNGCRPFDTVKLYEKTDGLRRMGIAPEKTIGFWDLPNMVVSHSMAISRKDFLRIGGFPEWIRGWGGEDTVLGFLACAAHIPICLVTAASYQASHRPYSGSEAAKLEELRKNIEHYRNWAGTLGEFPLFSAAEKKQRGRLG